MHPLRKLFGIQQGYYVAKTMPNQHSLLYAIPAVQLIQIIKRLFKCEFRTLTAASTFTATVVHDYKKSFVGQGLGSGTFKVGTIISRTTMQKDDGLVIRIAKSAGVQVLRMHTKAA